MKPSVIRSPRLSDSQILNLWDKLEEISEGRAKNFKVSGDIAVERKELEEIEGLDTSFSLDFAYFMSNDKSIAITFRRGISEGDFNSRTASLYFDEFQVQPSNNAVPSPTEVVRFTRAIQDASRADLLSEPTLKPPEVSDFMEAQFSQLSALVTKMASQFDDRQAKLDKYRADLEQKHIDKISALEKEHQERLEALAGERKELEKLRLDLDDRDNVHVRRELRGKITEEVQQRLESPSRYGRGGSTQWLVVFLSLGASAILYWLAYTSQLEINAGSVDPNAFWFSLAKAVLAGIAATGFVAYAIAWVRKIHLDNAEAAQSLERYALDIDRASWAIETIIEMSKKDGAEIPTAWVEGVCEGLFSSKGRSDDVTALHALGALMDVAGGAEIGTNGTKISLNRRGTKALARQVTDP